MTKAARGSRNLSSVGILNRKDRENILARCWSASTKARTSNSAAGSGPALAISFCAVSILNCKRSGSISVPFSTSRPLVGTVGTKALTAAEMRRCHWVKPVMVCQIKFTEWTRDDRLRQPVFLRIREDKNEGGGSEKGQLANLHSCVSPTGGSRSGSLFFGLLELTARL